MHLRYLDVRLNLEPPAKTHVDLGTFSSPSPRAPVTDVSSGSQLTCVLFTAAHPLALVLSWLWMRLRDHRGGLIALPPDEDGAIPRDGPGSEAQGLGRQGAPREVDAEALWG